MRVSLDKTIRAMSIALDLAELSSISNTEIVESVSNINYSEHRYVHHSRRTAYVAMEIGITLSLQEESLKNLYIASLLHDIGAPYTLKNSKESFGYIRDHCKKGSSITEAFPYFNHISQIILYHHENWDGSGPMRFSGDNIPMESQIIRIADLVELCYEEKLSLYKQRSNIINWINSNKGIIFSEKIVQAFLKASSKDVFWFNLEALSSMDFILDNIAPKLNIYMDTFEFENIAYILSKIIDSKSIFTAMHSRGIASLAYEVSKHIGYDEEKCLKMKIAGLLHDIGKLAIPTKILDKPDSLTDEEFSVIKSHVYYTKIILDKIGDIPEISEWASNHHEKLNGKGYPRALVGREICEEARIIGVCDIYQALTEDRPYRKGLDNEKALSILDSMVNDEFICGRAVQMLKDSFN